MLKLKKIQILGFKSFSDRTEVTLPGQGVAIIVGPNGCGKSNILDAVSWVLGEQSARSLRGGKMEDVIFAGTRDRKPLGMAEVSLTLVDPEAYEGPLLVEPEVVIDETEPDWDEEKLRAEREAEVEEIIAESQPGVAIDGEAAAAEPSGSPMEGAAENGPANEGEHGVPSVVLKIRRRKFNRTPQKGEMVVTRRLFRTGDSEYLLNGKLCRLRDIQDIFMGTGLGPESYAIIGQERIGQLLSSRPHDRRAIIEEAAGITRFKTKKRLAELRLEQAKQNLARVNDIFEEVTRQMASLKRQAAKAERYGKLRDEMRAKLKVVLASRIAQMDGRHAELEAEIASLTEKIDAGAERVSGLEAEHTALMERGYLLEDAAKDAETRAHQRAVEIERADARHQTNQERIAELDVRMAAAQAELEQAAEHVRSMTAERDAQRSFLETAEQEAAGFREQARQKQDAMRTAVASVSEAEMQSETARRRAAQLLSQVGNARNQITQGEEAMASLVRESERLGVEMESARRDLEALGAERGQISMTFESVTETLRRLEGEIGTMRSEMEANRTEEQQARRYADGLRAEHATLSGRRTSLESLIREHSYSTDTVRKLFQSHSLGGGLAPVGTLADFLEVNGQYESVVDEFLRDELNYIVVKSWDSAHEGMRLLKTGVDGRATFLVHPEDAQAKFSFAAEDATYENHSARPVVPLRNCIRVLDGFGRSLEVILPKLRDGYVAPDSETARSLALENPSAFFLSPSGETFHNVTVTGGKPGAEGPLALKRELRETQEKLAHVERELSQAETRTATLAKTVTDLTRLIDAKSEERRQAEKESANQSAALRQMEMEVQRLERRLHDWTLESERNRDARAGREGFLEQRREEAVRLEAEQQQAEAGIEELQRRVIELRTARDLAQQEAAQISAELAGLEERRRGAEQAFARIDRMFRELENRVAQITQQLAAAKAEQEQRSRENEQLVGTRAQLIEARDAAQREAVEAHEQIAVLRTSIAAMEHDLKALRVEIDAQREARGTAGSLAATLTAELRHAEEACVADLGIEAVALREEAGLERIEGDALVAEDMACREMKQRLESMGPVNMMALEEYNETAQRHTFLETQRKDLLDSIDNTQATIKEIDEISRTKFDEAFARINENFGATFGKLFGGGQAFIRLTDEENVADSGIDIVVQPPGKKLQNVLLLSGGEKALTALSLLVGIFLYQPSPFCVLDEVDAPLDETNVGRLADMMRAMAEETQFVIVTHSRRMMQAADMIYGVTMQEPGVSKVVSVRLGGNDPRAGRAAEARLAMA
ncbi:MAG TPA: chromosome segregation protein SMC [Acidobacteriaceae bacterium]|jgi:chromosome segregation protein|nr:chromosome segregation protein SMC [Acidobacteriaceae bacterium]